MSMKCYLWANWLIAAVGCRFHAPASSESPEAPRSAEPSLKVQVWGSFSHHGNSWRLQAGPSGKWSLKTQISPEMRPVWTQMSLINDSKTPASPGHYITLFLLLPTAFIREDCFRGKVWMMFGSLSSIETLEEEPWWCLQGTFRSFYKKMVWILVDVFFILLSLSGAPLLDKHQKFRVMSAAEELRQGLIFCYKRT